MKTLRLLLLLLFASTLCATADLGVQSGLLEKAEEGYAYKIEYVILTGIPGEATDYVYRLAAIMAAEFTQAHAEMMAELGTQPGIEWDLSANISEMYLNDALLAFLLQGYDFRGGAHGMPVLQVAAIRTEDGGPIEPADLFLDSSYLEILSRYCRQELRAGDRLQVDDGWLERGTEPTSENFSLLMPGYYGITVHFPPYQIGSYAEGPHPIVVPYSVLKGVLNRELFPIEFN